MTKGSPRLPSPGEARDGAIAASANAFDLLTAARRLAANGKHGLATSLLVLALEEALKARVLVAIATDDEEHRLPDDQVREILSRDHNLRIRAASAEAISPATIIGVLTTHPRDRTPLQQKQLAFDVAMLRWHSEANSLKHRGLYVSFAGGGWESPRDVGEEEFLRAMKFVKPLVKVTINQTARLAP